MDFELVPKMIRLSPNKVVFKVDTGPCSRCKKSPLIVAERNHSLRCFTCGSGMADPLCWFCENGINPELLALGSEPSCLLGKETGYVKFCEDFAAGLSFGECWKNDIGERERRAKRVFAKVRVEKCSFCEHKNTENIIKAVPIEGTQIVELYQNNDAAFCELGEKSYALRTPCNKFKLAEGSRKFFESQKTKLPKYFQVLQVLEVLFPQALYDKKRGKKCAGNG